MKYGGIDVGSRYIKYAVIDGEEKRFYKMETGHDPLSVCHELIRRDPPDNIVATGYGRYLLELNGDIRTITEIKAVAKGAKALFPQCRTIIDIGGQDTKVISLNEKGLVVNFEMNDRCAAGTGRFLEVMAKALGYDIEEMGSICLDSKEEVNINSMCTVFAESEVISLITRGVKRESIGYGLHKSIVSRVMSMLKRIGIKEELVFAGGCAKNRCLKEILRERAGCDILVYEKPEMLSAIGAALYAID
ncbi:MAG: activase [Nitrospirae bacterium]|nr:MAG: activase [Nitrospirota bacterium]